MIIKEFYFQCDQINHMVKLRLRSKQTIVKLIIARATHIKTNDIIMAAFLATLKKTFMEKTNAKNGNGD